MVLTRTLGRSGITIGAMGLGCWARSSQHIPIPGFRTVNQVEDNCGALEKGPLTELQMQEINQILQ
ncbi:MAG: hypothetical protein CL609_03220 [Anaerolineaceae bacterium]|nr:hypothetical protein [Anaerolineaceae bacterium]